jgi:hypothetical protein
MSNGKLASADFSPAPTSLRQSGYSGNNEQGKM